MGKPKIIRSTENDPVQGVLKPLVAQKVTISGTTARNSTSFTNRVIRLTSTVDCYIKFGTATVEAAATDHFLPGGVVEYFTTQGAIRVAAITDGAGGTLFISEMG